MKKTIIIVGLVLALGIGSAIAYADSGFRAPLRSNYGMMRNNRFDLTDAQLEELAKDRQEFHEKNMEYRQEELNKAYDNGEITKEEYNSWSEHFNYMNEFHKENGFYGGCGRRGMGMMRGFGQGRFY